MPMPIQGGAQQLTTLSAGGSSYGFNGLVERLIEPDVVIAVLSNVQSDGSLLHGCHVSLYDFTDGCHIMMGATGHNLTMQV